MPTDRSATSDAPQQLPPHGNGSLAERVAVGLSRIGLVERHERWRAVGRTGLPPTQGQILSVIAGAHEPPGVRAVADRLALTQGTVSAAVSALVARGLVSKTRAAGDGRAVVLRATAEGRRACAGPAPEAILDAVGALPEAEQGALLRGLVGLIHHLQARGAVPTGRMCVSCRYFRPNEHRGGDRPHHCAFIDAPIADTDLRLDCPDMRPADRAQAHRLWPLLVNGERLADARGEALTAEASHEHRSSSTHTNP